MSTENRIHDNSNEIVEWDAVALSQKIRSKDVSCVEVLHSYLDHVDRLNPIVNAIVDYQDRDTLSLRANELDAMLAKGDYCGPLHGMPQAPKDTMPAKGLVTSKGSPIFAGQKSTTDSVVFERMRRGGSIFIGRTNCPEFALGGHTYNSVYGATTNAFDQTRSAGGSSGGAAVATALHMLPVADGSDMMGSLRTPAAFNNVFGFRTSMGAVPHGPTDELFFQQFSVTGPMARNIPDLALLLSVQAGYDSRLPLTRKQEDPAQYLNALERDFKGSRIGWLGDLDGKLPTDQGLLSLCESTLQHFEAIGCTVENAAINANLEGMWNAWIDLRSFYFGHSNMALYNDERTRAMLKPEAIWEFERAIPMTAARVFEASKIRSNFYRAMMTLFDKFDFLIMPAAQVFPFPVDDHWPRDINGKPMDTYHRWMEAVLPATMAGLPSMAAPAGFNAQGLPAGIQIIGRPQSDFEVLQISHAYDLASKFSTHRSPLL